MKHHIDLWLQKFPDEEKKVKRGRSIAWRYASRRLQKSGIFSKASKYALKAIHLNPFQWKA